MSPVNGTVIHINIDLLAQQLLVLLPQNRILIHGQTSINR